MDRRLRRPHAVAAAAILLAAACNNVAAGGSCTDSAQCGSGEVCFQGECRAVCIADADCPVDQGCYDGLCSARDVGPCDSGGDCSSGVCLDGACQTPTCEDETANGDETDRDCGGSCDGCADGLGCSEGADCVSQVCGAAGTCSPPSCSDGVRNGDESDEGCGGSDCPVCVDGRACRDDGDCASQVCTGLVCRPIACRNEVEDPGETDVDCGGPSCSACGEGGGCQIDGDCSTAYCRPSDGTCRAPSCDDLYRNGDETDADCGGSCPDDCADGRGCLEHADCLSAFCRPSDDTCQAPGCGDGFRNGDETASDCGGSCPGCPDGLGCAGDPDCAGGFCHPLTLLCTDPTCEDGYANDDESDTDCGGSCPDRCANGAGCASAADCVSGRCSGDTCAACGSAGDCAAGQGCNAGACGACSLSGQCRGGEVCAGGACSAGSSLPLHQCPQHGLGVLGGGAWGNYWCDGQAWSNSGCWTIEFPTSYTYPCSAIGRTTLAAAGVPAPPGAAHVAMYQCPSGISLGGGAWGYYGCQGQVTNQTACSTTEYPNNAASPCTFVGNLALYGSAPAAPPGGSVLAMFQCPSVGSIGGGAWGFYGCVAQLTSASSCLTVEFPNQLRSTCDPAGFIALEPP